MITIVSPSVAVSTFDRHAIETALAKIETAGRTCYKSVPDEESTPEKFVRAKIRAGHLSIIEHVSITVVVVCDRGVSHEIVRHRIAAYSQESTRYVNYHKRGGCVFIKPCFFPEIPTGEFNNVDDLVYRTPDVFTDRALVWVDQMFNAAASYEHLIALGAPPQEARAVLPNSTKTEIVVTYNLREWRHFLALRALGVSGAPHPQMKEIAGIILQEFQRLIPGVFEDLDIDKRRKDFVRRVAAYDVHETASATLQEFVRQAREVTDGT